MGGAVPTELRPRASARSRAVLFRLAAILVALLPFIALEAGLRLFDLGRPGAESDPLSGFNRRFPLFERQGRVYRTARAREPFVSLQEFPAEKPPNGFRIFCFGGSTVYGHPYLADTAFPKWLEIDLAGSDPSRSYQAINCGGVSYASYREAPLVKEVLEYQPDLVILATGHNEFLEDRTYHVIKSRPPGWAWLQNAAYSLRIVNLARHYLGGSARTSGAPANLADTNTPLDPEVRTRLDEASGYASYHRDDAWHERVVAQFDESVRDMVTACRDAGVPIILVKLGSNLRDCPPFKSEHRAGLSAEAERAWQAAFASATAAEASNLQRALELYRKAEAIDSEYALLDYRIARVLDRLGNKTDARTCYVKARDEDICPLRIITPLQQALTRIAVETGAPLTDAAGLLAAHSPDAIPGFDAYLDHVHPTTGGHQKIAQAIAEQMRRGGLVGATGPVSSTSPSHDGLGSPPGGARPETAAWSESQRRQAYARQLASLGPRYFADGRRRVEWLDNWARRQRLYDETLPKDALGYVRFGFRRLEFGDEDGAWQAFDQALQREPALITLLREHADELLAEGRPDTAAALLQRYQPAAANPQSPITHRHPL